MNLVKKLLSGLLLAGVAFGCSAVELKHWPADAAAKLNALVKTHGGGSCLALRALVKK